jgi:hypothetical protein
MGFANSVIGGAAALIRAAIKSPNFVSGAAGWQISKDGSAEFNNLIVRGTFDGTDFEINSAGAFFYSGVPAAGNLIISIAPVSGTDPHGNAYPSGLAIYTVISGTTYAIRLGESTISGANVPGLFLVNETGAAPFEPPLFSFGNADNTGAAVEIYSGLALAGSKASFIECADSTLSGVTNGEIVMRAGQIDQTGAVAFADQWNTLGPIGNGWSTAHGRYRLTTMGELEIDIALTGAGATGTLTWPNTLPAAYRPVITRRIPGVPSSGVCHTTVNTGGSVSSTIPAGAGTFDCPGRVALD